MRRIYLLLVPLFAVLMSGCGGSSGGGDDASVETVVYAAGSQTESLTLAYGTPAGFTISVTDKSGNPLSGLDVEVVDGNDTLQTPLFVQTGADGKADVNVSVKAVSVNGTGGTLSFVVYTEDPSLGYGTRFSFPYTVAPWDMKLWNGEIDVRVPAYAGLHGKAVYKVPDGVVLVPAAGETVASGITFKVNETNVTVTYDGDLVSMDGNGSYERNIGVAERNDTAALKVNLLVGDGTAAAPLPLRTFDELNATLPGNTAMHYILSDDITMNESWTPVDFSGSFDGNGHKVTFSGVPLFQKLNGATVENLAFTGSVSGYPGMLSVSASGTTFRHITSDMDASLSYTGGGTYYVGLLGGSVSGTLTDITLDGTVASKNGTYAYVGMVAGSLSGSASFITVTGRVNVVYATVPIAGSISGSAAGTISDTYGGAVFDIIHYPYEWYFGRVGGIVGHVTSTLTIERTFSDSDVSSKLYAGGLIGRMTLSDATVTIKNSYYAGNVSGDNDAGGLVGWAELYTGNFVFQNAYVTGTVTGGNTGGILGWSSSNSSPGTSRIKNTLALSSAISNGNRISSYIWTNNITAGKNYAYAQMLVDGVTHSSSDGTDVDGADITPAELTPAFFTDTLGWDPAVWDFDFDSRDYKLPILKSHNVERQKALPMPGHLQ